MALENTQDIDAAVDEPDHGATVSRFSERGIDLSSLSPEDLESAISFQKQYGGGDVYTSSDVQAKAEELAQKRLLEGLERAKNDPKAREELLTFVGVSPSGSDEEVDPTDIRMKQLEQSNQALAQKVQSMEAMTTQERAASEARQRFLPIEDAYHAAVKEFNVEGSDSLIRPAFINAFSDKTLTPTSTQGQIRAFIKDRANDLRSAVEIASRTRKSSVPLGGASSTKIDEEDEDAVMANLLEQLKAEDH